MINNAGQLVEPVFPHRHLGIVHMTGETKKGRHNLPVQGGGTEMRAEDGAERARADYRDVHAKTCASSGCIGNDSVKGIRIYARLLPSKIEKSTSIGPCTGKLCLDRRRLWVQVNCMTSPITLPPGPPESPFRQLLRYSFTPIEYGGLNTDNADPMTDDAK